MGLRFFKTVNTNKLFRNQCQKKLEIKMQIIHETQVEFLREKFRYWENQIQSLKIRT